MDRMATVLVPGTDRIQASFVGVAKHYGVGVDPCPPRRPNRKGVVEKAIHYIAQRWWRTAAVGRLSEAQDSLDRFCETIGDARRRVGGTVGELADTEPLLPLPAMPYPAEGVLVRKVAANGLVSVSGRDLREIVRVAGRVGFPFKHPFAVFWPGPPVTAELSDDHRFGAGHVTVPGEHFGQFSSPIPFLNPVALAVDDLNFDTTADCWNRRNGHVPQDTQKRLTGCHPFPPGLDSQRELCCCGRLVAADRTRCAAPSTLPVF